MKYLYQFGESLEMMASPCGRYIAIVGQSVWVYDFSRGERLANFQHLRHPRHICFSHDGNYLAVKNTLGKLAVYDLQKMELISSHPLTKKEGHDIFFTPDDRYVLSADQYGRISLYDWKAGQNKVLVCMGELKPWNRSESDLDQIQWPEQILNSPYFEATMESRKRAIREKKNCVLSSVQCIDGDIYEFQSTGAYYKLIWKYPFEENEYELKRPFKCEVDRYNSAKQLHACFYSLEPQMTIRDREGVVVHALPNAEGNDRYLRDFNWSKDGEYLAVIIQKSAYETADGDSIIRVHRTVDWKIVKEYTELPFACFVGFSEDSKYFLVGTWKKGYCVAMEDIINEARQG